MGLRGIRQKLAAIFLLFSILGCSLVFFGITRINHVSEHAHRVMAERIPLSRAAEEAILSLTQGAATIDRVLLIGRLEEIEKINALEAEFKESVLVFSTFIKAMIWGSETEAFLQSAGGRTLAQWERMGLKGTLVVLEAPFDIQQAAGKADLYFGAFSKYVAKAIAAQKKILNLKNIGAHDEMLLEIQERDRSIEKINRFKVLVDDTLQDVVSGIYAHVGQANEQIGSSRKDAIDTLIGYSVVMFVLALIIGYAFAQSLSKPLIRLKNAATEIAKGAFDTRVEIHSQDELGALADAFNLMVVSLRKAYDDLEKTIRIRTSELSQTNRQLLEEITDREMAELELRAMADKVQEAKEGLEVQVGARTKELESFVRALSHDLKGPVVSLQGMTAMFIQEYGNRIDEKGRHYIQRISSNVDYMDKFIQGMQTLTQIGPQGKSVDRIEIREAIAKVISSFREAFAAKKIQIFIDPKMPLFVFGSLYLIQLFENLIGNAIKFMGDQAHPRIEIGGTETKEWLQFYVKDNGMGIDPAYHQKIFDPFQQLKDVGAEGVGIGLSIITKIIGLSGGKGWVESKKGEGATFFIRIPQAGQTAYRDGSAPIRQQSA